MAGNKTKSHRGLNISDLPDRDRRSLRPWYGNIPPDELLNHTMGECLSERDQMRLGRASMDLWRALVADRGYAQTWLRVNLVAMGARLNIPLRTVERARARLEAAGMIESRVDRKHRLDEFGQRIEWRSVLSINTFGGIDLDRGRENLWVPTGVTSWCETAPEWGGKRANSGRKQKNQDGGSSDFSTTKDQLLTESRWRAILYINIPSSFTNLSSLGFPKKTSTPGKPGVGRFLSQTQTQTLPTTRSKILARLSKPKSIGTFPLTLGPEDGTDVWVRAMVSAYNAAVMEVFQTYGKIRLPDDPRKSTLYDKLVAAAKILVEHRIPPKDWAVWSLSIAKGAQEKRCATVRPTYILGVFSPSYIERRRGWWRSTSTARGGQALQITPEHLEQYWRMREISNLKRGCTPEGALIGLDAQYATMRRREIGAGYADPMDLFPKLPG